MLAEEKKKQKAIIELEKVLKAMSRKVIPLEEQVVTMKEGSKENKKNDPKEPFEDASDFQNSTLLIAKQKLSVVETKSVKSKNDNFKCEKCDYKCKKESTLIKHKDKEHADQEGKEDNKRSTKLQESDKMRLHKTDEKEELSLTQKVKDINKSLVFSESMLDEFL